MSVRLTLLSFAQHWLTYGCVLTGSFRNDGDTTLPAGGVRLSGGDKRLSLVNLWPIEPGQAIELSMAWTHPDKCPDTVRIVDYVALDGSLVAPIAKDVTFSAILGTPTIRDLES